VDENTISEWGIVLESETAENVRTNSLKLPIPSVSGSIQRNQFAGLGRTQTAEKRAWNLQEAWKYVSLWMEPYRSN